LSPARAWRPAVVARLTRTLGVANQHLLMPIDPITAASTAKAVAIHATKWLHNLWRAGEERQKQSLRAIDKVIPALRLAAAYSRGLQKGIINPTTEGEIAAKWSELANELEELGLRDLAKKCDVKSRYWADPDQFAPGFLEQADIGLEAVEKLARELKAKIRAGTHRK
jgi:hypothetical protein